MKKGSENVNTAYRVLARLWLLSVAVLCWLPMSSAQEEFGVGSKAPAIDVEHWVQTGEGKFKQVKDFEPGKVYVIEFWATWCGPCVDSMPHLVELQKKYADKQVQIVSISDEDLETVEQFLERKVPAKVLARIKGAGGDESATDAPMTFKDLTKSYCLTTDPDGSVQQAYMEASGQMGIPTAFIVGKDGYVEWIGHPMEMDEPLEKVVAGSWDRDAYKAILAKRQMIQEKVMEIFQKYEGGEFEEALKKIDEVLASVDNDPDTKSGLMMMKAHLTLASKPAEATESFRAILPNIDNPEMLNELAWAVVEAIEGKQDIPRELIGVARQAAEKAAKLEPKSGAILDTLAHLVYYEGDLDKAIEIQTKASQLEPDLAEIEDFLAKLKKEKASKGK